MRNKAFQYLRQLSADKRNEAELRTLLDKGVPPAAPAFYAADPLDPEVQRDGSTLETELLLCWSPAPDSLVRAGPDSSAGTCCMLVAR